MQDPQGGLRSQKSRIFGFGTKSDNSMSEGKLKSSVKSFMRIEDH